MFGRLPTAVPSSAAFGSLMPACVVSRLVKNVLNRSSNLPYRAFSIPRSVPFGVVSPTLSSPLTANPPNSVARRMFEILGKIRWPILGTTLCQCLGIAERHARRSTSERLTKLQPQAILIPETQRSELEVHSQTAWSLLHKPSSGVRLTQMVDFFSQALEIKLTWHKLHSGGLFFVEPQLCLILVSRLL